MSTKRILSALLKSRDAYERVGHLLGSDLGPQEVIILEAIKQYYERDPSATIVDPVLVAETIARTLPNPKHQTTFRNLVSGLWDSDVSAANVVADFIEVRRAAAGSKLATALAAGKPVVEVEPLLRDYSEWASKTELEELEVTVSVAKSIKDILAERRQAGGLIRVVPQALNDRLGGGLLRGHHLIVFARPETGKTLILINMASGFAKQGLKVLYCGNEDPLADLQTRMVCRMADMTRAEVEENQDEADARAFANGYGNVVFAELTPGTLQEIERLCEEHKPDVVIVDQLRNLNVGEDNFVRALEKAASGVRTIGKRQNCLLVSATQAGDSASGKSVLDMGDVDSSNTGIPAQCDVLLGAGMSGEDEARGIRVFSLCKNKPGNNHDYFPVSVEPAKSKVRS
jgi:KaiC/GvpD/RAD55 family RecA-like ATPase